MTETFTVACVQVDAGEDRDRNVAVARDLIREAGGRGAALIALPEVCDRRAGRAEALAGAVPEAAHPMLRAARDCARETGAWILLGSIAVKLPGEPRLANRSILIDPEGAVVARYDKIHMFDVRVGDGHVYRESETYRPGETAVLADTPLGRVGITVCYDMRFPRLYRALAQAGATILTMPSNFTRLTGEAHWEALLRARAIENACFVIAPAQCGAYQGGRESHGHSIVIDPWGVVLAEAGAEPGVVTATLDPEAVSAARARLPSLTHDRPIQGPIVAGAGHSRGAAG